MSPSNHDIHDTRKHHRSPKSKILDYTSEGVFKSVIGGVIIKAYFCDRSWNRLQIESFGNARMDVKPRYPHTPRCVVVAHHF